MHCNDSPNVVNLIKTRNSFLMFRWQPREYRLIDGLLTFHSQGFYRHQTQIICGWLISIPSQHVCGWILIFFFVFSIHFSCVRFNWLDLEGKRRKVDEEKLPRRMKTYFTCFASLLNRFWCEKFCLENKSNL